MKYKTKLTLFILLILLICLRSENIYSQDADLSNDTLIAIANSNLQKELKIIRQDDPGKYGFNSENDFTRIKLGSPIRICTFPLSFYKDSIVKSDDQIILNDKYQIPLILDDTIRSFLIIARLKGNWKVVGAGGNFLANRLDKCIKTFNLEKEANIRLLRDFRTYSDYLYTDLDIETGNAAFYPVLSSASNLNNIIPQKKYSKEELFTIIKREYYKNIKY